MASYALVNRENWVELVAVADEEFVARLPGWFRDRWPTVIRVGGGDAPGVPCGPGWSWDGKKFDPPTQDPVDGEGDDVGGVRAIGRSGI